ICGRVSESFLPESFLMTIRALSTCLAAAALVAAASLSTRAEPAAPTTAPSTKSPLDFTMKDIDGKDVNLADYKGKVVLIVNTATRCGLAPQFEALEKLYKEKQADGLVVLGFPANNF